MIEVGRNSIVIRNVDKDSKSFKNVRYKYGIYDKVYRKYKSTAYTEIDQDLYFPASVGWKELKKYFPSKDVSFNYKTTAKSSPITYTMKNQPRNELQREAIKFVMNMKNDYNNRERFLTLATGSGKTYVTINAISQFKKKSLIIVDSLDLAAQWKREFLNHSSLKDGDIVILSGADSVNQAVKENNAKIYVAIHMTITNMLSEDLNSMNLLMNKLGIGFRIFDEAHVNFKNICMINALSNVEYTLYLTATPGRSNFSSDYLYGRVLRNIPYFDGKHIQDTRYHTVVLFRFNSKPTIDEEFSVKTKYGFSISKWASNMASTSYSIFEETFFEILERLKLQERANKIAIILPTLELIDKVKESLETAEIDCGIFTGKIKKDKRKDELDKKIFLTNDKMFDKGIDVKDLDVVINFVSLSSNVKTQQIMGRLRKIEGRPSILIDVTDNGYLPCVNQFKLRRRFYKKNAKKIIEIEKNID